MFFTAALGWGRESNKYYSLKTKIKNNAFSTTKGFIVN
jgi:hypothetical protein